MHLGNGAITPECAAITIGTAAVGLTAAAASLRREPLGRQKLALAAGLGAMVFAAQAINAPVLPGTSAHLVGGVLLAWVLGPGLGAWAMAIVLAVQALVLGDGGLAALGANILNMALVPAGCVVACRRVSARAGSWSHATCAMAAAGSVPLAALLIVGQTALFRTGADLAGWQDFAVNMLATHAWIGLLEGGLTLAAVAAIAWLGQESWKAVGGTFAAGLALALVALPWSSAWPDGYEAAASSAGLEAWLAAGSSAVAQVQSAFVTTIQSAGLGEQGCLLAALVLVGALIVGFGFAVTPRQAAMTGMVRHVRAVRPHRRLGAARASHDA
jgi:cobalt/nickel transport system permease protein